MTYEKLENNHTENLLIMDELKELFDNIELRLTSIEIKLDALLYALEGEEDEPGGDQYGAERNSFNTL